jgi:hypothetical protein
MFGVTLDPELAETPTSGYIVGFDYHLLLRAVISYTHGSESSLGLNYHSGYFLGEGISAIVMHRCKFVHLIICTPTTTWK